METILLAKCKLGEVVTLWEIVSTQDGSPGALVRQEPYMVSEVICNILSARVQKSIQQSFSLQYIQIYIELELAVNPHTNSNIILSHPD